MSEQCDGDVTEPHDPTIDVINAYKKDVDRTLLRENLRLTVEERLLKAQSFHQRINSWQNAIAEIHALLEERDQM